MRRPQLRLQADPIGERTAVSFHCFPSRGVLCPIFGGFWGVLWGFFGGFSGEEVGQTDGEKSGKSDPRVVHPMRQLEEGSEKLLEGPRIRQFLPAVGLQAGEKSSEEGNRTSTLL